MSALEVEGLNKTFKGDLFKKDRQVLFDVSFRLREKVTTGFVGSNGAGKTTTIKCLLEFIFPNSGHVKFFGKQLNSEIKTQIGYLPERPYLYEFLNIEQFLSLHWRLCFGRLDDRFPEAADKVIKKVNLNHARGRPMRTFSKGMLQRAGIAQAILTEPQLIILDEPMSGLDPDGRLLVKDILLAEKKRGVTLFFSSHLLNDMEELCEDLLVIDGGKIRYTGGLEQFMKEAPSLEEAFRGLKGELSHD